MSKLAHSSPFMDAIEADEEHSLEQPRPSDRIVTSHEYPPIPPRQFDWCAYRDSNAEGNRGWGPTEQAAIADLLEQEEAPLTPEDQALIDAAWERHKAAGVF